MDYYTLLGVRSTASRKQIAAAHRRLRKRLKRNHVPGSQRVALSLDEAFDVLGNDARRKAYDIERFGMPITRVKSSYLSLDREGSWTLLCVGWLTVVFGALGLGEYDHPVAARVVAIGGSLLLSELSAFMVVTFIRRSSRTRLRRLLPWLVITLAIHTVLWVVAFLT